MKPHIRTIACCCLIPAAVLTLAACGNKGPLSLPPAPGSTPAKPPASTAPVPSANPANQLSDHSSRPSAAESK